ncbi:TetR/AcrR family transcriptional regulator [Trinickia caryophylli]
MKETLIAASRTRGRRRAPETDGREHLLDCATRLFAEKGIAATTMAQIADAGGVTSAMVHYYFRNRETLLDVIVEERIMQAIEFVWQIGSARAGADPITLAHALVDRLFDVTGRMPWLPSLWLREIVNEGGMLRERVLGRLPVERLQQFARQVKAGQKAGTVRGEIEPSLVFLSILALVMLPLATAKVWQGLPGMPEIDRETLHRHVAALLANGLHVSRGPRTAHAAARSRAAGTAGRRRS